MTNNSGKPNSKIVIAIVGALGLIIAAFIGYAATIKSTLLPIEATQTAEVLHSASAGANQAHVAIETMGISASPYSGENFSYLGDSKATLSTVVGSEGITQYWLDYEIFASGKPGQAVLEFKFQNLQNLIAYKYIEFTVDFITPNTQVGFYFENANENGQGDAITLSNNLDIESVIVTHLENERYRFQIPLDRFTDTNMSNVSELGIYVHSDFIVGKGKIMIENISFEVQ